MPTEMLTGDRRPVQQTSQTFTHREPDAVRVASWLQAKRVRRLKIDAAAWALGIALLTTLWAVVEWRDNGVLESFGHEGDPGQWNPTLWAIAVGVWTLTVGIMALRVYFERPPTDAEVDRGLRRTGKHAAGSEDRRLERERLERLGRLEFHVAAWVLAMLLLTPIWALIEWQDNGGLERFGNSSRPGEWEPWILYVGGIWAIGVAILALTLYGRRQK